MPESALCFVGGDAQEKCFGVCIAAYQITKPNKKHVNMYTFIFSLHFLLVLKMQITKESF